MDRDAAIQEATGEQVIPEDVGVCVISRLIEQYRPSAVVQLVKQTMRPPARVVNQAITWRGQNRSDLEIAYEFAGITLTPGHGRVRDIVRWRGPHDDSTSDDNRALRPARHVSGYRTQHEARNAPLVSSAGDDETAFVFLGIINNL